MVDILNSIKTITVDYQNCQLILLQQMNDVDKQKSRWRAHSTHSLAFTPTQQHVQIQFINIYKK